jgi:alpha-tubulin suppressor-like RCC1 family protein
MTGRGGHLAALGSALLLAGCGRGCHSGGSAPLGAMHPPAGFTAAAIAVGSNHVCALRDDGAVWCWGRDGGYGQLGDGTTDLHLDPRPVPGLRGVTGVASGFQHTCTLLRGGEVRCWGENRDGQLGDGTRANRAAPVPVLGLPRARAIHAGPLTTCAEAEAGGLWCWGHLPATGSEPDAWGGSG